MRIPDLFTPSERRLAALLFALTVLGAAVRWGEHTSPEVKRWLDDVAGGSRPDSGAGPSPSPRSAPVALGPRVPADDASVSPPSPEGGDGARSELGAGAAESTGSPPWSRSGGPAPAPLDPNRAGAEALVALPGVGPVLARRIVEERERSGPFRGPDDLLRVRGIGPATLNRLRPYLRFGPGPPSPAGSGRGLR
jgi:competence ComEA-like helix-hairpin-helix protein